MRYEIRTKFKKHKMLENTVSFITKKDAYRAFGWFERQLLHDETIALYRLSNGSYKFIAADHFDENEGLTFLNYDPFAL